MFVPNKSPAPGGSLNIRALRRHLIRWTLWRKLQRIGGQEAPSFNMVRLITLLAAVAAATTAVIVPASCFLVAQARLRGEVEIRALVYAGQVAEEARRNPDFWNALADTASEL